MLALDGRIRIILLVQDTDDPKPDPQPCFLGSVPGHPVTWTWCSAAGPESACPPYRRHPGYLKYPDIKIAGSVVRAGVISIDNAVYRLDSDISIPGFKRYNRTFPAS